MIVEGLVLIAYALNATSRTRFGSLDWRFRRPAFTRLLKIGIGTGVQITAEVTAWSLFMVYVIGSLGPTAMAANQFMFRYMAISFMPAFGISQAVTALVGRSVGEGRADLAVARAGLGYRVATIYMILCGVGFAVFRRQLMGFFTDDPAVIAVGSTLLLFAAVYQLFDAMNVIYKRRAPRRRRHVRARDDDRLFVLGHQRRRRHDRRPPAPRPRRRRARGRRAPRTA